MQVLSTKLCTLINAGISMVKENASTALGTIVDRIGEEFTPYLQDTIQFLINSLD